MSRLLPYSLLWSIFFFGQLFGFIEHKPHKLLLSQFGMTSTHSMFTCWPANLWLPWQFIQCTCGCHGNLFSAPCSAILFLQVHMQICPTPNIKRNWTQDFTNLARHIVAPFICMHAMYCAQIGYSLNKLLLRRVLSVLLIGLEISHIQKQILDSLWFSNALIHTCVESSFTGYQYQYVICRDSSLYTVENYACQNMEETSV